PQACASVTTPAVSNPHLAITKTATESSYNAVGQVIHYTIVATNDRSEERRVGKDSNPKATRQNCTTDNPVANLAPGATISCTASHTIVHAHLAAYSFYTRADVSRVPCRAPQACASVTTPAVSNPHLAITKTATESSYNAVGQVIHYTIVATND